jgi:hypothetical protein
VRFPPEGIYRENKASASGLDPRRFTGLPSESRPVGTFPFLCVSHRRWSHTIECPEPIRLNEGRNGSLADVCALQESQCNTHTEGGETDRSDRSVDCTLICASR